MNKKEIITELKSHQEYLKIEQAAGCNYSDLIEAIDEVLKAISLLNSIKDLNNIIKRAEEAEMLLREVQPFCPVLEKNMISDFFKK